MSGRPCRREGLPARTHAPHETVNIAFITYVKPEEKWKQLRRSRWAHRRDEFRTRSGHYQQNLGDLPNQTSELFKEFVDDIATNVMKSATVANTAFFARATPSTPDAESCCAIMPSTGKPAVDASDAFDKRCGCRRKHQGGVWSQ